MPWYFRLGIIQDQNAIAGHIGARRQINYAIGLNLAGDRWIPDELCRVLPRRDPDPLLLGSTVEGDDVRPNWVEIPQPLPEPPHPNVRYLVDYCVFGSTAVQDLGDFPDEFEPPWEMEA